MTEEPPSSRRGMFRDLARSVAKAIPDQGVEPPNVTPAPTLTSEELERYERQLALPGWGEREQLRLRAASVLVVGAGALGSPVATYLVGAGVGQVGIVDDDVVELSNLPRQHLHSSIEVDESKAHSAAETLQQLNHEVIVEPYQVALDADNAESLLLGHDLVMDCTDSFRTRYEINAACCQAGIPLVEAGVVGLAGMVMSIRPGRSACYRCAFPEAPADAPTCAEAGVLGPATGVIGSLQALEALKLLSGIGGALLDAFLQVDLTTYDVLRVATARRPDCPDCGD